MRFPLAALVLLALPAAASTWEADPAHSVAAVLGASHDGEQRPGRFRQDHRHHPAGRQGHHQEHRGGDASTRRPSTPASPSAIRHLKSADFFDVEKFPTMTFKSTKITKGEGNKLKVEGNLTIHGVTKPVVFDAEVTPTITPASGNKPAETRRAPAPPPSSTARTTASTGTSPSRQAACWWATR